MKTLIAIHSCCANASKRAAQRATWLGDLYDMDPKERADYRFFVGRMSEEGEIFANDVMLQDIVLLDCPDDRAGLSLKQQAVVRWAFSHSYDRMFKCDDDTYVVTSRLLAPGEGKADYAGYFEHLNFDRATNFPVYPHAQGGPGYWLSRKALAILAKGMPDKKHQEDFAVGEALAAHRDIAIEHDSRYCHEPLHRDGVISAQGFFTLHKCDPAEMRRVHARVKKFRPAKG